MLKKIVQSSHRFLYELPILCLLITSFFATLMLLATKHDYDARKTQERNEKMVVITPSVGPELSQESVEMALVMFNIEVPPGAKTPTFDANLQDRGLTTLRGWGSELEVAVGPAAFESWGLLGSTLAHELEVHCKQSFALIRAMDILGMEGTQNAEREAYLHELSNARRFNLGEQEQANIKATMDFYYPESANSLSAQ